MVDEARLVQQEGGLAPATDGWFVVNVRDSVWLANDHFGTCCIFEGDDICFPELGYTLAVLQPGQTGGLYHRESTQEAFLVLAGECLALIEGDERRLHTWDFVHCPPDTEHIFVGTGDGPCVIFMAGARTREKSIVYPLAEVALRHGAGAEAETAFPAEAYAPFPTWRPGRPGAWDGPPWSRS